MNGVCTHVVRLNVHSKKLDYYTGNYDLYYLFEVWRPPCPHENVRPR